MKKTLLTLLTVCIALTLASTGCAKKKGPPVTKLGAGQTGNPTGPGNGPGNEGGPENVPSLPKTGEGSIGTPVIGGPLDANAQRPPTDLANMTPNRDIFAPNTVYFEFDRSAVRQSEQANIQAVAKVLKEQPNTKVQVEGHCDERGTEEYNRALGEKRALAIREYLMNLGIEGGRVYTISYGEDKPKVQGHSDDAWTKNRRGEFILYTPK
jgi:peptidoglycan-associated lipoprotein